jgi:hypothetical protein
MFSPGLGFAVCAMSNLVDELSSMGFREDGEIGTAA